MESKGSKVLGFKDSSDLFKNFTEFRFKKLEGNANILSRDLDCIET